MPDTDRFLKIQKRLWENTAFHGANMIEASGWRQSKLREPFTDLEMEEFVENVYLKLKVPYLSRESGCSIMEIGSGSGLLLKRLLPYSKLYDAVDISEAIIDKCRLFVNTSGMPINFHCLYAHEIDRLQEYGNKYDVIIMNSVMQYFPDYDYAIDVLSKCSALLKSEGIVFCGDIMDKDKYEDLLKYNSRIDNNSRQGKELFYEKSFFKDIGVKAGFAGCNISDKIFSIQNELSLFRYDAIMFGYE